MLPSGKHPAWQRAFLRLGLLHRSRLRGAQGFRGIRRPPPLPLRGAVIRHQLGEREKGVPPVYPGLRAPGAHPRQPTHPEASRPRVRRLDPRQGRDPLGHPLRRDDREQGAADPADLPGTAADGKGHRRHEHRLALESLANGVDGTGLNEVRAFQNIERIYQCTLMPATAPNPGSF